MPGNAAETFGTILIVDDVPVMHHLLSAVLRHDGYRLVFAHTGNEALELLADIDPDLIVLDVMMPDMDGFEICRRIRSMPEYAEVPIIMLTALTDRAALLQGIEAGADDFVSKPFDQTELRARARSIIRLNRYRRLVAERSRYQRLVDLSPDGIVMIDERGVVQFANSAMLALLRCPDGSELLGQPLAAFIDAHQQADWSQFTQIVINRELRSLSAEFTLVRCDAAPLTVEITAGGLEWNRRMAAQVIVRDITERMEAAQALKRNNQELALLNRASQAFGVSLDLQQVLDAVLTEFRRLFDVASASVWLFEIDLQQLVCRHALGSGSKALQNWRTAPQLGLAGQAFISNEVVVVDDAQADPRHPRQMEEQMGLPFRSVLCAPLVSQNKTFGVLQLVDDRPGRFAEAGVRLVESLTAMAAVAIENAWLFRAVSMQRGQLRALASRLADIQEQERQLLARELHDQIGQNLTALNLNLTLMDQMLPPGLPNALQQRLHDSMNLVSQANRQVRNVMTELRPPVLDDYGLLPALRWYGEQFSQRTGVTVQVDEDRAGERCTTAVETALFRIAQEALNNVAKHADASEVIISFECDDSNTRLSISDDGQGFDVSASHASSQPSHWGLLSMKERAMAVGGDLQITSHPGTGTTIAVEVSR